MSDADENFARNMKRSRELRGMSQEQLAATMSRKGFRWYQATVYKVENGDRRVQLGEAQAIAEIMQSDLSEMLTVSGDEDSQRVRDMRITLEIIAKIAGRIQSDWSKFVSMRENFQSTYATESDEIREAVRGGTNEADIEWLLTASIGEITRDPLDELVRRTISELSDDTEA